jgi:hypothetical protein
MENDSNPFSILFDHKINRETFFFLDNHFLDSLDVGVVVFLNRYLEKI